VASRWILVLALAELGEFTEGIAYGQEAVRIAEPTGHLTTLLHAYNCLSFVYLLKGDLQQAIPVLDCGLALCQAGDVPIWPPVFATALGAAYMLSGRLVEALALLEQVKEQDATRESTVYPALWDIWLSEAYLLSGRLEEAHALAERALELAQAHQEQGHAAYTLRLLGEIAAWRAPLERTQAETHYQQALTLADELGMRPLVAHCHRGLGTLYSRVERLEEARTALSTALHMYRTMEMSLWLPPAEATLAQIRERLQRHP
jgi:tetratricopeptide (TPR) repeat protein